MLAGTQQSRNFRSGITGRAAIASLIFITILASIARFRGLGAQSLWYDESLTWRSATAPLSSFFRVVTLIENTPPLYFMISNGFVRVFGDSDAALRAPAALFGVACIPAIYWLVIEWLSASAFPTALSKQHGAALIVAAYLAVSPYHVWYSQEARTYTLVFLLMVCSTAALLRWMRTSSRRAGLAYVIATSLALYSHPFSMFAWGAQLIYVALNYAVTRSFSPRTFLTLVGGILVVYAPWIPRLIDLMHTGQPWLETRAGVLEALIAYAGSVPLLAMLATLSLIAIIVGIVRRDMRVLLAVLLCIAPIACPLALSSSKQAAFHVRYGLLALIGMLMLAGYAVTCIKPWARAVVGLAVLVISVPHLPRAGYADYPGALVKIDMRSPARIVAGEASPRDVVILADWWMQPVFEKYCRRTDLRVIAISQISSEPAPRTVWLLARPDEQAASALRQLESAGYSAHNHRLFEQMEFYALQSVEKPPKID